MTKPRTLVAVGYGINCDRELEYAFSRAGAEAERVHVDQLIQEPQMLRDANIFGLPGGFAFGDDTFAGNIFAKRIKYSDLQDELRRYLEEGKLVFGVCNGNQIGSMLNLIPIFGDIFSNPENVYTNNKSARYEDRGNIHMKVVSDKSYWLKDIDMLRNIPVGHGEGQFYTTPQVLDELYKRGLVALKYVHEDGMPANGVYPINPNGSMDDIAGLASETVLMLMPHPERAIRACNQDGWTRRKSELRRKGLTLPQDGEGMKIFRNAVEYFA
ncbi:MAG: phosphoribosylformylglycinamidine synthase subunit PurQ [Candidatus Aenigmatarchaeota archaeon]